MVVVVLVSQQGLDAGDVHHNLYTIVLSHLTRLQLANTPNVIEGSYLSSVIRVSAAVEQLQLELQQLVLLTVQI